MKVSVLPSKLSLMLMGGDVSRRCGYFSKSVLAWLLAIDWLAVPRILAMSESFSFHVDKLRYH